MAVAEQVECSSAQSSSLSKGVHYLAKCVIRGSVVLQVVYGHIRSPFSRDVVFGKETSIELVIIGEDGIVRSICEQAVFGIIKDLAILRWNEKFHVQNSQMTGKDLIVILSDSGKLSFLTFCNELHRFFPVRHIQLSNAGNSTHHLGRMLTVDSSGCFMAASAYEDRLVLFSISASRDIVDQKIYYPSENEGDNNAATGSVKSSICGTIWSMCFISKEFDQLSQEHSCLLAILLNRRGASLNELLLLEWNTRENAAHVTSQYAEAGSLAHDIIDIPHFPGFAFLFMLVDVLLMDLRDAHNPCCVYRINLNSLCPPVEEKNLGDELFRLCDVDDERIFNVAACALLELRDIGMDDGSKCPNPMKIDGDYETSKPISRRLYSWTWGPGDDKNPRLIFCVDTGEFYMFEVCIGSSGFKINHFDCLYRGLACKELLWIEGGFLVALYEMGDGMVFKLENGKLLYNSPIQNIAPILNMSVVDYHKEKQDQMFACCGVAPEGSLRIIQNGISVDKLLKTAPVYQGITGTWTIRMRVADPNHSFLVLSFVEETRVLSVGLSFSDVTDSVGFQSDASTLACGIVSDGLLVQIHQYSVRLCLPTKAAHSEGIPLSSPISTSWLPDNSTISLGAVKSELIIVATSNPCLLFILGVRSSSAYHHEIYEMQHVRLRNEVSCISIPQGYFEKKPSASLFDKAESFVTGPLAGVDINHTIVIGTHKPSVEVLTFVPGRGLRALATGPILLTNTVGTAFSGCVPQDVRLVLVDKFYVLSGLRNGMLLRFELPAASLFSSKSHDNISYTSTSLINSENMMSNLEGPTLTSTQLCMASLLEKTKDNSPVCLQLISIRRIGITPVFLVPLSDSLDADIIALSDRPWLLHTARHSLSYTSISFQPSTHVTPVCSVECPKGILFVAENSLHLVEMMRNRRLNVQKFNLEGTPRKVIYHNDSRLLFVMRTDLDHNSCSSDICGVDPLSGSVISSFKFNKGETGKSMILMRVGNEHILVVGTSRSSLPAIMPSGEAESIKGRLLVLVIEHIQNSDSGSMTHSTKADSSSQRTSPFHESVGLAAEQLSSSSLCSSPDDSSYDGVKLEDAEAWHLRLDYACVWTGVPLALFPYLDRYFLASCGDSFYVCGFQTDGRVRKFAVARTRFMIVSLTAHLTRIAVGDCRDGILFFSYHEESRKLEHLYSDPEHRLVADCILIDEDTAVVSDRKGCISVLSSSDRFVNNASPERNLRLCSSYYTGEVAMSIRKGSFSYKLPVGDVFKEYEIPNTIFDSSHSSIITSTLLGSIMVFIPITREENDLLEALQERLAIHPLTAPLLGNDHTEFRSRETSARCRKILDGDMLMQFLELTSTQQEAILSLPLGSPDTVTLNSKPHSHLSANRVAQLLERIHHSLG